MSDEPGEQRRAVRIVVRGRSRPRAASARTSDETCSASPSAAARRSPRPASTITTGSSEQRPGQREQRRRARGGTRSVRRRRAPSRPAARGTASGTITRRRWLPVRITGTCGDDAPAAAARRATTASSEQPRTAPRRSASPSGGRTTARRTASRSGSAPDVERRAPGRRRRPRCASPAPSSRAARTRAGTRFDSASSEKLWRVSHVAGPRSSSRKGIRVTAASATPPASARANGQERRRARRRAAPRGAAPPAGRRRTRRVTAAGGSSTPGARRRTAARRPTASAAAGSGPRAPQEPLGEQQQPRQQRPHAGLRPGHPDDEVEAEGVDERRPAARRAKRMPERARQQERPERRGEHLQHRDHAERPPERQDVGQGRLNGDSIADCALREERPPAPEVRVPERRVGQPVAGVLQPGLELHGRVDQLVVRAERPHVGRPLARPGGRGPEVVRGGQRVPGHEGRRIQRHGQQRVDQGRRERRPGAQPVQDRPRPRGPGPAAQRASASGCVAVPLHGPAQALLEADLRRPAGQLAQLGRVDVLAVDLARAACPGPRTSGVDVGARDARRSASTTSRTRVRLAAAGVERLAARRRRRRARRRCAR